MNQEKGHSVHHQPPSSPVDSPPAGPPAPETEDYLKSPQSRWQATRAAGQKIAVGAKSVTQKTARMARKASGASGAAESGLFRLIELHALGNAGDAALAIGLAGTMFFGSPTTQARPQVATFLLLTMLPFAVVAPFVGPMIDKYRHGRRWALGSTFAVRAFLCWVLAGAISEHSYWLFPAALGVLVASKAYIVTKSAAAPKLLPEGMTLVKANGRMSLSGVVGAGIGGALAGLATVVAPDSTTGASWALRVGFGLFIVGTILAILLPAHVDSAKEETQEVVKKADASNTPASVISAQRANVGLRWLSGFLTMFLAFLVREHPLPAWQDQPMLLLGIVLASAGLGSGLGSVLGSLAKLIAPTVLVNLMLLFSAVFTITATVWFTLLPILLLGFVIGLTQQLGKLSLDAIIQEDVSDEVRTSVFSRSETILQFAWVIGGLLGTLLPTDTSLGMWISSIVIGAWTIWVLFVNFRSRQSALVHGGAINGSGLLDESGAAAELSSHRRQEPVAHASAETSYNGNASEPADSTVAVPNTVSERANAETVAAPQFPASAGLPPPPPSTPAMSTESVTLWKVETTQGVQYVQTPPGQVPLLPSVGAGAVITPISGPLPRETNPGRLDMAHPGPSTENPSAETAPFDFEKE